MTVRHGGRAQALVTRSPETAIYIAAIATDSEEIGIYIREIAADSQEMAANIVEIRMDIRRDNARSGGIAANRPFTR